MVSYPNFYETIAEARMRLDETVVLYDGEPYYLLTVCDHKPDGIFRAYLDPLPKDGRMYHRDNHVPFTWQDEGPNGLNRGQAMDKWMDGDGKNSPILRKMLNSPKFNKFRPFPLGMLNSKGRAYYVERAPTRHTQQGLTGAGLHAVAFDLLNQGMHGGKTTGPVNVGISTPGLYDTIKGIYPDVDSVLVNLTDESIKNSSTAFHREFSVVRGPMDLLFVAYKGEVVGFLPYNNTNEIKISKQHSYVKEAVDELACFNKIS